MVIEETQKWIETQYNGMRILVKTKYSTNSYTDIESMLRSFISLKNKKKEEGDIESKELLEEYIEKLKKILINKNKKKYKLLEKYYK